VTTGTPAHPWRGAAALALLVALAAGMTAWTALPGLSRRYYLMLPGAAFPVAPRIVVPDDRRRAVGDLSLTVVYQQATDLPGALLARGRYGVRVVPYEDVIPRGTTEEESSRQFRQALEESSSTAAAVALRRAGFPVRISGRGVRVTGTMPGLPAARAVARGDVVVAHGLTPVRTVGELTDASRRVRPGDEIELTVRRDGQERQVRLATVPAPAEPERAMVGMYVETIGFEVDLPFEVRVEERVVGGPSAGLMFALGIYDAVTDGRLADGHKVAGTGTLDMEGRVGGVAGIAQKVIGAEQAGADVFIVPADSLADASRVATGIRLVPVRTFDEALAALGGQ
jgi:PDZ domain-containing protein